MRLLGAVSVLWIPLAFLFDGVTVLLLPIRLWGDTAASSRGGRTLIPGRRAGKPDLTAS